MARESEKLSFSQASERLDSILEAFKSPQLPLENALTLFEEGVGHLKFCQKALTAARGQVDELVKTLGADGEIVTRPFQDT
ncbi:MAG: exodeoxyribonuclease VII small subunit [Cyanobacteria bacterium]|nr:exodeoxyribonuclease VII small subunit [Cyanobacteriota bacterium]